MKRSSSGAVCADVPGTPGWWAARPAPPRSPRRGRPPRSFARIIAAAADLLDEVGPSAFSMRLLAERLSTSTATLYRHVSGKEELLVHVVDHRLGELFRADAAPEPSPSADWQQEARALALAFYRGVSSHPHLLPLLVTQIPLGPNGLRVRELILSRVVELGVAPQLAARAYTTIAHYVVGFALQQHAAGAPGPEDAPALVEYFRGLDPETYPHTIATAEALPGPAAPEDEFLEGLQFILDGIEAARRAL